MILKFANSDEMESLDRDLDEPIEEATQLSDNISDLFELPAGIEECGSQCQSQDIEESLEEVDEVEDELPLPPRKRVRPARYRDSQL